MNIKQTIEESIRTKQDMLSDAGLLEKIEKTAELLCGVFRSGGKVLFCGNGGSAADAQHLAAELSGRFYLDRPPLEAEALHCNTSYLTAAANDYGYGEVYSRMIQGFGKKGDVLIGLSTSGNSPNILKAVEAAKNREMTAVAFTGSKGGKLRETADILLNVPSDDVPRIQESHILIGHILCGLVEERIFGTK